jgi:hypothetical protein
MPDIKTILDAGANGLLLIAAGLLILRWAPAAKQGFDELLATFERTNQAERDLCLQLVREERARSDKMVAENNRVIERNTQAVDGMRTAVAVLAEQVRNSDQRHP